MFEKSTSEVIKKTAVITLTILAILTAILGLWKVKDIVAMVFISYVLVLALQHPIRFLQRVLRMPLAGATILAYVFFLIVVFGAIGILSPIVVKQLYDFIGQFKLPDFLSFTNELGEINLTFSELSNLIGGAGNSIGQVFSVVGAIFGSLFNIFTVAIVSFHMSMDHQNFYKKIYWFTDKEERVKKVKDFSILLEKQLGGWINGELLLMLVIGVVSYIGFAIIGIPYALPLAILAGFLEVLPNLGPIIAAIPAIAAALISLGPVPALITAAFCIILQQLENAVLVPQIMKATAKVNPLISILVILAGFVIFGVAGALLAIPTYIAIRAAYGFWWKKS